MKDYIIRQAKLDEIGRLWDFLAAAYDDVDQRGLSDRWTWQYLKNPYGDDKSDHLPIWIAEKDDSIVGQICTLPVELRIGNVTLRAVWGVDLIVLPSCRGGGVGRRLIENVVQDKNCYMAVDMSDITRRIYDRLGYIRIDPVPVYRKIVQLSSGLVLEYLTRFSTRNIWASRLNLLIPKTWVSQCLAFVINRAVALRKVLAPPIKKKSEVDILKLRRFGPEINELWAKVQDQYGIIAKRDQKFLNWRFTETRHPMYEIFGALRRGELTGYVVLRKGQIKKGNFGYIVDLLADRNDRETIESLVRHAVDFFGAGVEAVECAFTPKEYQNVLKKYGFIKMKESIPYSACLGNSIREKMEELKGEWFITRGDSDWDLDPATEKKNEGPSPFKGGREAKPNHPKPPTEG